MNETIISWLAGFSEDGLGPGEGWAVFPQGERVLKRYPDILGGEKLRRRLSFLVRRNSALPAAGALEEFARWAQANAPILGEGQTVRVEDARLAAKGKDGLGRYECKLIFEFTTSIAFL